MAGVTRAVATGHVSPGEAACGSRECDRWLSDRRCVALQALPQLQLWWALPCGLVVIMARATAGGGAWLFLLRAMRPPPHEHACRAKSQPCFSSMTTLAHLHDCERQARRSHGCASIRLPRLPHKAVLGEVAEGLAQESSGGARTKHSRRHRHLALWDSQPCPFDRVL